MGSLDYDGECYEVERDIARPPDEPLPHYAAWLERKRPKPKPAPPPKPVRVVKPKPPPRMSEPTAQRALLSHLIHEQLAGRYPTMREIAAALDRSLTRAKQLVNALVRRGYLTNERERARGVRVIRCMCTEGESCAWCTVCPVCRRSGAAHGS